MVAILSRPQCVNIGKADHENIYIQLQFYRVSCHLLCWWIDIQTADWRQAGGESLPNQRWPGHLQTLVNALWYEKLMI